MTEWEEDCMKWHGEVLRGQHAHWCVDWDGLPLDETCAEYHLSDEVPADTNVPCRSCGFASHLYPEETEG